MTSPDPENNLDEEVSLAAQNMPSSFGITFFVRGNTDRVRISLKYGTYRKSRLEDCRIPFTRYDRESGLLRTGLILMSDTTLRKRL